MIIDDVVALRDLTESNGKKLTTIFTTQGHGDHVFGSDRLLGRGDILHISRHSAEV